MEALSLGAAGMISAASQFDASAARTASGQGDFATEVVRQLSAKTSFEASANVMRAADRTVGSLLDMIA